MKFYAFFFAVFVLLITGCSGNLVTIDREESDIVNEEPPHLVEAYNALWMEISYEQSRGIIDTSKVFQANRIAIELSKYDGPMSESFETFEFIINAHAAGKSIGKIKDELKEFTAKNYQLDRPISKTSAVSCDECWDNYWADLDWIQDQASYC